MKKSISPSILAADLSCMNDILPDIKADYIHLDVMDGVFVPNITFGIKYIKDIRKYTDIPFDTHLMIVEPEKYIKEFADAGSDLITFHLEATDDPVKVLKMIKGYNKKCGISIKPDTDYTAVKELIPILDLILIMSVEPGFSGQKFIPSSLEKIRKIKELVTEKNRDCMVAVDGGIYFHNIQSVLDAGCDMVIAGSMIFNVNYSDNIKKFRDLANE